MAGALVHLHGPARARAQNAGVVSCEPGGGVAAAAVDHQQLAVAEVAAQPGQGRVDDGGFVQYRHDDRHAEHGQRSGERGLSAPVSGCSAECRRAAPLAVHAASRRLRRPEGRPWVRSGNRPEQNRPDRGRDSVIDAQGMRIFGGVQVTQWRQEPGGAYRRDAVLQHAGRAPRGGVDGEHVRRRAGERDEVVAAVERRPEHDVVPVLEQSRRVKDVPSRQMRDVGADEHHRARLEVGCVRDRRAHARTEMVAVLREHFASWTGDGRDLGQYVGRIHRDVQRRRVRGGHDSDSVDDQHALQPCAPGSAQQWLQPGLCLARTGRAGHHHHARLPAHASNR